MFAVFRPIPLNLRPPHRLERSSGRCSLQAIARAEAMRGKRGTAGKRAHALPMQEPGQERLGRADARVLLDVDENEVKECVRWVDVSEGGVLRRVVAKEDVERVLVSAGCVFTDNGIRRHPHR
jgi:hypothetical protein